MERLATVQIPPTTVVHSGHGLQAFWLFDRLLDVSMDREAAARGQAGWINLQAAALVLLPDMPPPPRYESIRREQYMEGLSYLKSIAGGDPILIERKNKDP